MLDSVSVSICSGEGTGDESSVEAWVKIFALLVVSGSESVNSGCVSYGGNQMLSEPELSVPEKNVLVSSINTSRLITIFCLFGIQALNAFDDSQ